MLRTRLLWTLPLIAACGGTKEAAPPPPPPVEAAPPAQVETTKRLPLTKAEDVVDDHFGVKVADPYRWLEDGKAADVQLWMEARDKHARAHLAELSLQEDLRKRYKELLYVESRSAPVVRGGRLFFSRKPADKEKSIHYWQDGEKGEPKVLLDPNEMSDDGSISIGAVVPSKDGRLVAYMEKGNNADESTLKVMEVDTGEMRAMDTIGNLRYTSPSWTPDGKGFFYTWMPSDPSIPPNERMGYAEIRYHVLGTRPTEDKTYREKTGDPSRWQAASVSDDGKYLFLYVYRGWSEADIYVMFLKDRKHSKWRELAVGTKASYMVEAHKDTFYVATSKDAPRWKIFKVSPRRLARKSWKEIVPQDPEAVLDSVQVIGGKLALKYLRGAATELVLRDLSGKNPVKVELPAIGSASSLVGNADLDTAYFSFSSFNYPPTIFKTSVKSPKSEVFAKVDMPVDPSQFEVKRVTFPSKDGTKVSMFIVHKKGIELDGKRPTLMYGYGGFNISLEPRWSSLIYPWIERGGVYAMPNLRGGGEYGEAWHEAGMLAKKQNVFDDFIAAGEYLVANKYTSPAHLGLRGGSNGGLLVGAAMTQRPDLFGAIICAVPLLDMVRYHMFGVGNAWVPEYGVATNEEQFKWLYAYSPYHNVKKDVRYPSLLMLSADSDDRVDPLHARKFVAMIEAAAQDDHVNLLRIESNAGHGGGDMRKKTLDVYADQIAFLWSELN